MAKPYPSLSPMRLGVFGRVLIAVCLLAPCIPNAQVPGAAPGQTPSPVPGLPADTIDAHHSVARQVSLSAVSLGSLLVQVLADHPAVLGARMESLAAQQDIEVVERARWPSISATVESMGGTSVSGPTRAVQVEQTLWDFGRIGVRISDARNSSDMSLQKIDLVRYDLALQTVVAWQSLQAAAERSRVALQTKQRLQAFREQMLRRVEAKASAKIDLELADARILQTEVEIAVAQSSLRLAIGRLDQLTGTKGLLTPNSELAPLASRESVADFIQATRGLIWEDEARKHPAVLKAMAEVQQTRYRLDAKKADNLPQVYARFYKPLGSQLSSDEARVTAFLGLRYAPGAGFAGQLEARSLATRVGAAEHVVDTTLREVALAMQSDREELENNLARIGAMESSVRGSAVVLESYQRQFQAGRKSWLDLLNAVREMAQNQYALADARAAMAAAMERLQIRIGQLPQ